MNKLNFCVCFLKRTNWLQFALNIEGSNDVFCKIQCSLPVRSHNCCETFLLKILKKASGFFTEELRLRDIIVNFSQPLNEVWSEIEECMQHSKSRNYKCPNQSE